MIGILLLLLAQAPADSLPPVLLPPAAEADPQALDAKSLEILAAARESSIDPDTAAVIINESRDLVERISRLSGDAAWLQPTACGSAGGCLLTATLGATYWPPPWATCVPWAGPRVLGSPFCLGTAGGCLGGLGLGILGYHTRKRRLLAECREDVARLVERLNRALAAAKIPSSPPGDN